MTDSRQDQLSKLIREWVEQTSGWFDGFRIDKEFSIQTQVGKNTRRVILHRLVQEGLLKRHANKQGMYCLVSAEAPLLDWKNADDGHTIELHWPFSLEWYIKVYSRNLIVIAGSPNAGKTALCLNLIYRNMGGPYDIVYYTSEMGGEEMKSRLLNFEDIELDDWTFECRERSRDFAEVIQPDKVNIVDFLEITDTFYLVGEELRAIFEQLTTGIAIVCLQKKRGAELGRGAEFSLEKPRLYLSMDNNQLKIVKAKNWRSPTVNPNGKKWNYKLIQGCKFVDIQEVFG